MYHAVDAQEARARLQMRGFIKAALGTAKALAGDEVLGVQFSDQAFDPLHVPGEARRVLIPNVVNLRSRHLLPHLRMRFDMAGAWIAGRKADAALKAAGGEHVAMQLAFEKARREALLMRRDVGVRDNILSRLTLSDFVRDFMPGHQHLWPMRDLRDIAGDVIGQGFYVAALASLVPELTTMRPDLALIGKLWRARIDEASPRAMILMALCAEDEKAERYTELGWEAAYSFQQHRSKALRPLTRHELYQMGFHDKKSVKPWRDKNLAEVHLQLVTGKPVRMVASTRYEHGATSTFTRFEAAPADRNQAPSPRNARKYAQHMARVQADPATAPRVARPETADYNPDFVHTIKTPDAQLIPTDLPEADKPLLLRLAEIMAEDDIGRKKPSPGMSASTEFNARRGRFMAAYLKLRGEHELVTDASKLAEDSVLRQGWDAVRRKHAALEKQNRNLARKFDKWLAAQTGTRPVHDREDGRIDPTRLTSVITSFDPRDIHIDDAPAEQMDTAVTLLFDNSGSMHGEPFEMAVLLSNALCQVFERRRVASEVLGFTTHGAQSRHIVFKPFRERLSRVAHHFGVAQHPGHMGGTSDVDAILWALSRLDARPEARKILAVVSDAQPNAGFIRQAFSDLDYDELLRSVVHYAPARHGVEVIGIGVGAGARNLRLYYPNGVILSSMAELGPVLVRRLQEVLDPARLAKTARADALDRRVWAQRATGPA